MNDKKSRRKAYSHGVLAEIFVSFFYRIFGYRLVSSRHRTPFGEIDLIMRRGKSLVFIEVKARKKRSNQISAFSERQQKRVFQAAEYFLYKNFGAEKLHSRIDYVIVGPELWRIKIISGADRFM